MIPSRLQLLLSVGALVAITVAASSTLPGRDAPSPDGAGEPRIVTSDVRNFIAVAASLDPSDPGCEGLDRYFDEASEGLREYSRRFKVDQERLCQAMQRTPERYDALEATLAAIQSKEDDIRVVFEGLSRLVPGATWPPVYFVVGNGVSGGSATRGRDAKILIGAELLGGVEHLPRLIAHEAVHTQQRYRGIRRLTGGPAFLRGTVLRHSINEGAADFLTELITGEPPSSRAFVYGAANEAELWPEFERDMRGREYRLWLYNGWNRAELGDRPADLGYFFGYRITRAYYERAADKQAAVREILAIRDFDRFFRASGYGQ